MIVEQTEGDALQRPRRGAHLGEDVDAVLVVLDHPLQTSDLALDAAQALEVGVLVGGVATFDHGSKYTPSGYSDAVRVGTKLAAYGLVLAVAFGAGAAVGAAIGPDRDDEPAPTVSDPEDGHEDHAG